MADPIPISDGFVQAANVQIPMPVRSRNNVFIQGNITQHVTSIENGSAAHHAFSRLCDHGQGPCSLIAWRAGRWRHLTSVVGFDGPMGAGKTAAARSIAQRISNRKKLFGLFIFRRGEPGRNDASRFVTTLAYQMALSIPATRPYIEQQIMHDMSIFQQSLSCQLDALIIAPLQSIRAQYPDQMPAELPNTLVVDGLDECGGDDQGEGQIAVLNLLRRLASNDDILPFSILVHSRPERQIMNWFTMERHNTITSRITLDSSYNPDADIRFFVKQCILKVLTDHPSRKHLPRNWPLHESEQDLNPQENPDAEWPVVEEIVRLSSGQFIFPSTAMKFIASPRHEPNERLDYILSRWKQNDTNSPDSPRSIIDGLYLQILDAGDLPAVTRKLLTFDRIFRIIPNYSFAILFQSMYPSNALRTEERSHLLKTLGLSNEVFHICIEHMASLVHANTTDRVTESVFLTFHHSSFPEFLGNPSRARHWAINPNTHEFQEFVAQLLFNALKLFRTESCQRRQAFSLDVFNGLHLHCLQASRSQDGPRSIYFEELGREMALLCDFPITMYRESVTRFLQSWITSPLLLCFDTIGKESAKVLSWLHSTKTRERVSKVLNHSLIDENVRLTIKPHLKRYLSDPASFCDFLKWATFKKPPPVSPAELLKFLDLPQPSPEKDGLPGLSVIWHYLFRKDSEDRDRLLRILSIPSMEFLEEAFILLIRSAGTPQNSLSFNSESYASFKLQILYNAMFSYKMWSVLLSVRKWKDVSPQFCNDIESITIDSKMVFHFQSISRRSLVFAVLYSATIFVRAQTSDDIDDQNPAIVYSPREGIWNSVGDSFAVGGSYMRAQDASASASITHEFTSFEFIAPLWPFAAQMQITIDGGAPVIVDLQDYTREPGDSSDPSTAAAGVRWTSPRSARAQRTITFSSVPNSDRPFVIVDQLQFSQIPPPSPPPGGPTVPGGGPPGGGPGGGIPGGGPGSGGGSGTGGGTGGGTGTTGSGGSTGGDAGGSPSPSPSTTNTNTNSNFLTTPFATPTSDQTAPGASDTSTSTPDPVDASAEKKSNKALIGGLSAMGVVILLVILAALALFLQRRRHQQKKRREEYAAEFKPTLIDGPPVPQNPVNGQTGVIVAQAEKDAAGYLGAAPPSVSPSSSGAPAPTPSPGAASAPGGSPASTTPSSRVPVPYHLAAVPTVSLVTPPIMLDGNEAIPRRSGVYDVEQGLGTRNSLAPSDTTLAGVTYHDARSTPTPHTPPATGIPNAGSSAASLVPHPSSAGSGSNAALSTAERTTPPGARPPSILPGTANSNPFASSRDELATPSYGDGMPERESQQLSLATRDSVAEQIWDNVTPPIKK
ncbi:hypothetical protein CVT24_009447 [Panaeolus cyanescens]|uniref:Nephrocystin 3-like N-terminal domain-containing protein n=1 Tax=Panaeolus cyanescens TaxID=181874 RepID=A0A409W3L3_9AGAR|nr:hypothetical protein CVT24_009447 [Panaeolus cyanescens]